MKQMTNHSAKIAIKAKVLGVLYCAGSCSLDNVVQKLDSMSADEVEGALDELIYEGYLCCNDFVGTNRLYLLRPFNHMSHEPIFLTKEESDKPASKDDTKTVVSSGYRGPYPRPKLRRKDD